MSVLYAGRYLRGLICLPCLGFPVRALRTLFIIEYNCFAPALEEPLPMCETTSLGTVIIAVNAVVTPVGVQATGQIGNVLVWSQIDPDQNPNWTGINDGQTPNWTDIIDTQSPNWTEILEAA